MSVGYKVFLYITSEIWTGICSISCATGRGTLLWRHNGRDSISNDQPHHCLLNRLFKRRSKKKSKLRVTGLCTGNSPKTGEFPTQMTRNAEMFPFDDVTMIVSVWNFQIREASYWMWIIKIEKYVGGLNIKNHCSSHYFHFKSHSCTRIMESIVYSLHQMWLKSATSATRIKKTTLNNSVVTHT